MQYEIGGIGGEEMKMVLIQKLSSVLRGFI